MKIALEEHLSTPRNNTLWDSSGEAARNGEAYMREVEKRLMDVTLRLEGMDQYGIGHTIISLTSPGVQSIPDTQTAVEFARETNDYIVAHYTEKHPDRLSAFATVPMQNPAAAAKELERAVKQLGMKGALINGYTDMGGGVHRYLDEKPAEEFWACVADLSVPVYLHPREPITGPGRRIYEGYGSLIGSAWGFAFETATHALRLMMSGLFDRHPNLTIILGHLGEGLTFLLPRAQHRLEMQREGAGLGANKKPLTDYFRENFYVTTSGHFHTPALHNAIDEVGLDRVLFSVDYPYERMSTAAAWFDALSLPPKEKDAIAAGNAQRLFKL